MVIKDTFFTYNMESVIHLTEKEDKTWIQNGSLLRKGKALIRLPDTVTYLSKERNQIRPVRTLQEQMFFTTGLNEG
jgi:hypothetical protein